MVHHVCKGFSYYVELPNGEKFPNCEKFSFGSGIISFHFRQGLGTREEKIYLRGHDLLISSYNKQSYLSPHVYFLPKLQKKSELSKVLVLAGQNALELL